ncbi:hypothetical protein PQR05_03750 [Paraburkholderia sediminicola]|uniref:Uncharacterized protein n=1 Tax=Paraburkholderia metrosideri TaxID=580937 RepID=A0ABW9DN96_9BURK
MSIRFVNMDAIRNRSAVASGPPTEDARTNESRSTTYLRQRLAA